MVYAVDKPPGWTPLEALDALRAGEGAAVGRPDLGEPVTGPMVYAGRLDPMAEGLLLVLVGEDRHALPAHLAHDKEYVATFLFGVASDTHDALGILAPGGVPPSPARCGEAVAGLVGLVSLPLPAWSAYRVRGRPLHAWAREGRLAEVERPVRAMRVDAVDIEAVGLPAVGELLPDVRARIGRVRGDFRQAAALAGWEGMASQGEAPLVVVRARLSVGSGTYVRALAEHVGAGLGCGALLLALRRTRVGPYRLSPPAPRPD